MQVRILISGLSLFGAAVLVATLPVIAQGGASGERKPCTIVGTPAAESLLGTSGNDVICGRGGADTIFAGSGNDIVRGGRGADRLQGGSGSDVVQGGPGRDLIFAYDGTRDRLSGGPDHDTLNGFDPGLDVVRSIESS